MSESGTLSFVFCSISFCGLFCLFLSAESESQDFSDDHRTGRLCLFSLLRCGLVFSLVFSYGEPPFYAQVARDAARLNFRYVEHPVIESTIRDRESLLSASVSVAAADEIKSIFLEFQSAGVAFHQKLKTQPWGAKNFIIKDPDGNLLLFAGPAN